MSAIRFSFTPLGPNIGAQVEGITLQQGVTDEEYAALNDALLKYQVLFFRNQPLEPEQQRDFAARFGQLHVHPIYPNVAHAPQIMVLDTDARNLPDNDNWHTDVTFIETPPLGAILAAKQLPPTRAADVGRLAPTHEPCARRSPRRRCRPDARAKCRGRARWRPTADRGR